MFKSTSDHVVSIFQLGFVRGVHESTKIKVVNLPKPSDVSPTLIPVSALKRGGVDKKYRGILVAIL